MACVFLVNIARNDLFADPRTMAVSDDHAVLFLKIRTTDVREMPLFSTRDRKRQSATSPNTEDSQQGFGTPVVDQVMAKFELNQAKNRITIRGVAWLRPFRAECSLRQSGDEIEPFGL